MNSNEQAVILKGIASQILQMNKPTFKEFNKLFKGVTVEYKKDALKLYKESSKGKLITYIKNEKPPLEVEFAVYRHLGLNITLDEVEHVLISEGIDSNDEFYQIEIMKYDTTFMDSYRNN